MGWHNRIDVQNDPVNAVDPWGLKECNKCDDCPCGTWKGKGHVYGGFLAIYGRYTSHMTYKCTCSSAIVRVTSSRNRWGVGLSGDWQRQWSYVWGVCNKNEFQDTNLEAGGGDGGYGVGAGVSGSGGLDEGSISGSLGASLGWNTYFFTN